MEALWGVQCGAEPYLLIEALVSQAVWHKAALPIEASATSPRSAVLLTTGALQFSPPNYLPLTYVLLVVLYDSVPMQGLSLNQLPLPVGLYFIPNPTEKCCLKLHTVAIHANTIVQSHSYPTALWLINSAAPW